VPHNEPPRKSQRTRRSAISEDYEIYVSEEIQMEGDPTSFEEAIRSAHSSKWIEAMKDEMRSMSTNRVWDLEEIHKEAKIVGANGSTRQNMTPMGILKDLRHDSWLKASCREKV
jgi:hypothetical protein